MSQLELDYAKARGNDPKTSHDGGADVSVRAGSQRAKLLAAYSGSPEGLTATEAAMSAGVSLESCYWKRCSELRQGGYIEAVFRENGEPMTRKNPRSGSSQEVNALTRLGQQWLENNK